VIILAETVSPLMTNINEDLCIRAMFSI